MKNRTLMKSVLGTLGCAGLLMAASGNAATVELQWNDLDDFRDIRATDGNKEKFQQRTLQDLEEQFRSEAEALPENLTLHITVKDLDLAGDIEYFHPGYPFGLRVVRNVDYPKMELAWELRDEHDAVVKSGDEKIHDMGFRSSTLTPRDHSELRYEKELISDWFQENFSDLTGETEATVDLNEES